MNNVPKPEIDEKVAKAARILKLEPYLNRKPKALSGGQRQRVAIGRAIVRGPEVFLFDEPLSNLDAELRVEMRVEIAKLHKQLGATMIYVTHDQVEAMTLADRIVVLSAGKIEQVGSPLELYTNPANVFVAKFIGSPAMNMMSATMVAEGESSKIRFVNGTEMIVPIRSDESLAQATLQVGVRPEDYRLAEGEESAIVSGKVSFVESLGEVTLLHLDVESGADSVVAKLPGIIDRHKGEMIHLSAEPSKVHLFDDQDCSLKYR
jgi:alpha-glucoside transport system ATP-binding protein